MTIQAEGDSSDLLALLQQHFKVDSVRVDLKEAIYWMAITGGQLHGWTFAVTPDDLLDRTSFVKLMLGAGVYLNTLGPIGFADIAPAIVRAAEPDRPSGPRRRDE